MIPKGATRWVFLTKKYAIKIPYLTRYRNFIWGILANMQEVEFSKCSDYKDRICPVIWHLPLGLLIVMPRCEPAPPLSREQMLVHATEGAVIPCEIKQDSFGILDGKLVAIDYG